MSAACPASMRPSRKAALPLDEVGEHEPVAHERLRLADLLGGGFDIVAAFLDELSIRLAFFERMDVRSLKVLDYLHLAGLHVREVEDARRDFRQASPLAGAEAAISGDDFEFGGAVLQRPRQHRNDDALFLDSGYQLFELLAFELLAARICF